jgi:hypothetical protein
VGKRDGISLYGDIEFAIIMLGDLASKAVDRGHFKMATELTSMVQDVALDGVPEGLTTAAVNALQKPLRSAEEKIALTFMTKLASMGPGWQASYASAPSWNRLAEVHKLGVNGKERDDYVLAQLDPADPYGNTAGATAVRASALLRWLQRNRKVAEDWEVGDQLIMGLSRKAAIEAGTIVLLSDELRAMAGGAAAYKEKMQKLVAIAKTPEASSAPTAPKDPAPDDLPGVEEIYFGKGAAPSYNKGNLSGFGSGGAAASAGAAPPQSQKPAASPVITELVDQPETEVLGTAGQAAQKIDFNK